MDMPDLNQNNYISSKNSLAMNEYTLLPASLLMYQIYCSINLIYQIIINYFTNSKKIINHSKYFTIVYFNFMTINFTSLLFAMTGYQGFIINYLKEEIFDHFIINLFVIIKNFSLFFDLIIYFHLFMNLPIILYFNFILNYFGLFILIKFNFNQFYHFIHIFNCFLNSNFMIFILFLLMDFNLIFILIIYSYLIIKYQCYFILKNFINQIKFYLNLINIHQFILYYFNI